jgi:large subunit ribosomal protein L22
MDIISTQKYIVMSPKKLRLVANFAKRMSPKDAVERLPFVGKRAADPIIKVIKSAMANARVKGISEDNMILKEIQISEGPRLKRGRPVSRGQWHPIKRRMSHIRVVITTRATEITKKENIKETKEVKKEEIKKTEPKKARKVKGK